MVARGVRTVRGPLTAAFGAVQAIQTQVQLEQLKKSIREENKSRSVVSK